jgi:hypothetical protein
MRKSDAELCCVRQHGGATWEDRMLIWTAIFWLGCAAVFLDLVERAPAVE